MHTAVAPANGGNPKQPPKPISSLQLYTLLALKVQEVIDNLTELELPLSTITEALVDMQDLLMTMSQLTKCLYVEELEVVEASHIPPELVQILLNQLVCLTLASTTVPLSEERIRRMPRILAIFLYNYQHTKNPASCLLH